MKLRWLVATLRVSLATITGAYIYIVIYFPKESSDPVCEFAKAQGMNCVILASPAVYERGAIIHLQQDQSLNDAIPLAGENLFSDSCVLPGANVALAKFQDDPERSVAFPEQTTTISRGLAGLINLAAPSKIGGFKIKAGSKSSESMAVRLSASKGKRAADAVQGR
jgi:hypothetical protein